MFTDTALLGLSKSLADTLGPSGIRVLVENPGPIFTPRTEDFVGQGAAQNNLTQEDGLERIRMIVPLGKIGQPDQVGDVITFLSSPRAGFVTGTSLLVDGGMCRAVT